MIYDNLDKNLLNSLQTSIANLINLHTLYLHNNQLSSLPAEILNIKKNPNIKLPFYCKIKIYTQNFR